MKVTFEYTYFMNFVWTSVLVVGLLILIIVDPENAFSHMLQGSEKAIDLSLQLWSVYAIWLGILQIMEDTGLDKVVCRVLKPIILYLFVDVDEYTAEQIAINITSNILGMGNASTPSGINAIAGMYKGDKRITGNMGVLVIFNTANIQLIPTTIIGIRILHKSVSASSIIIPTIATIAITTPVPLATC